MKLISNYITFVNIFVDMQLDWDDPITTAFKGFITGIRCLWRAFSVKT